MPFPREPPPHVPDVGGVGEGGVGDGGVGEGGEGEVPEIVISAQFTNTSGIPDGGLTS